eukprot:CAMPEP_0170173318 /NCGR_PEP_ID=MMETSP0040_2-20121228/6582_1 /TAXON_ID=641309 /ORGANISM="Lotharella oceanica, Strain CCMP622" /LENGTH=44 /DNA_ID= /DNA_START= /DNA_END= /DNA_ORIENTATION=
MTTDPMSTSLVPFFSVCPNDGADAMWPPASLSSLSNEEDDVVSH